jgi:hypothetical protein
VFFSKKIVVHFHVKAQFIKTLMTLYFFLALTGAWKLAVFLFEIVSILVVQFPGTPRQVNKYTHCFNLCYIMVQSNVRKSQHLIAGHALDSNSCTQDWSRPVLRIVFA